MFMLFRGIRNIHIANEACIQGTHMLDISTHKCIGRQNENSMQLSAFLAKLTFYSEVGMRVHVLFHLQAEGHEVN